MNTIRNIKVMVLAMLAIGALAVPTISSAAGKPDVVVTAGGIKVKPCKEKDKAPLMMFVRGISCDRALVLANAASSSDEPCLAGWHTRKSVPLQAVYRGKKITGPSVFLCTQKSGKRAFTYEPFGG